MSNPLQRGRKRAFIRRHAWHWLGLMIVSVPLTYYLPLPGLALSAVAFALFVTAWIGRMKEPGS